MRTEVPLVQSAWRTLRPGVALIAAVTAAFLSSAAACKDPAAPEPEEVSFVRLEAGGSTCALTESGRVYCWGYNPGVWLSGAPADSITSIEFWVRPRRIEANVGFNDIQVGGDFACATAAETAVYCWGRNEVGQLGDGTSGSPGAVRFTAEAVLTTVPLDRLAVLHSAHACALDPTGAAYCWGNNWHRAIGAGWGIDADFFVVPTPVVGGHRFRMVAAGPAETCGLTLDRALYCWGGDHSGLNPTDARAEPVPVETPVPFDTIGLGASLTCGLAEGRAYCRGWNGHGVLGTGDTVSRSEFAPVEDHVFSSISVGRAHVCALTADGSAYCWGAGADGRLGYGGEEDRLSPTLVAGNLRFEALGAGWDHTCGLTTARDVYCWGQGFYGQLGTGERTDAPTPVPVARPLD